jgi:cellobiose transport system permease protein
MMAPPIPAATRRNRALGRVPWWAYALLVLAVFVCVFPLYWMFVVASTDTATATQMPPAVVPGGNLPDRIDLVFTTVPFLRSMINSVIVAG